jgi:prevent-host-death family protein
MKHVEIPEAKINFSALLDEVEKGGQVVITRDGKPVAKLIRAAPELTPAEIEERRKAIEGLRELSRKINIKATPEEIKSWINEGRH